jgi:hypothetical protein
MTLVDILAGKLMPLSCLIVLTIRAEEDLHCGHRGVLVLEYVVGQPWNEVLHLICCPKCPGSAHQRADRGQTKERARRLHWHIEHLISTDYSNNDTTSAYHLRHADNWHFQSLDVL